MMKVGTANMHALELNFVDLLRPYTKSERR